MKFKNQWVICVVLENLSPYRNYAIDSRPLSGCGNLFDDATPNFISDSGSSILKLSNDISFVSEILLEGG